MVQLLQPAFDLIGLADRVDTHGPGLDCVPVSRLLRELDAIVRENGMDHVRNGFPQEFWELPGRLAIGFLDQLGHCKLAGSGNGGKEIKLTLLGPDIGDINVEIADGGKLELLALWLVAFEAGQSGYTVPLKAAMQ